jgi:hypothetical protein
MEKARGREKELKKQQGAGQNLAKALTLPC